ncbi:DUF357 domain-containing protein [Methanofollis fontis]|uniref:DUF357 domain-containing protein n=1 Tax=Methanofollis fontis TaxID=2052832 RepID=A0A483CQJ9_9EURY|nr:DUF357 domain-containing protein [Methanofollis fontis]
MPADQAEHLAEKSGRYRRLLDQAIAALEPAPDPETPMHPAASRLLAEGRAALLRGSAEGDDDAAALAWYSYGFGWLDAGVQAGLFRIIASREIFTV